MQQDYEYYIVDPGTWRDVKRILTVKNCTFNRDLDAETLGSATIDVTESLGECYVRGYLVTYQNGIKEKHPLGTVLVQTPAMSFDGKVQSSSLDAYTPLIELKENPPPLGYTILKRDGRPIISAAYDLLRENMRAPVIPTESDTTLAHDFVADPNDTWLSYINALIANAKYTVYDDSNNPRWTRTGYTLALDELGRVMFSPKRDIASMQPVWTYNDDNSSILHPEISVNRDLYGIPNVVEVVYSHRLDNSGELVRYATAENNDPNSPVSIQRRGRKIKRRITDPDFFGGVPSQRQLEEYAEQALKELSTLEYTVNYTHGYCPVRIGDCVRLNYTRAGLNNVKAKVISQSISCTPGCPVSEKAIFTHNLWG
jgi:hypothetical protein